MNSYKIITAQQSGLALAYLSLAINSDQDQPTIVAAINSELQEISFQYLIVSNEQGLQSSKIQEALKLAAKSKFTKIISVNQEHHFLVCSKDAWLALGKFNLHYGLNQLIDGFIVEAERQRKIALLELGDVKKREKLSLDLRVIETGGAVTPGLLPT